MKLISEVVAEVVDSKAEAENATAYHADTIKEEDMMAVADMEAEMEEAVGIIKLAGRADQIQEWCS